MLLVYVGVEQSNGGEHCHLVVRGLNTVPNDPLSMIQMSDYKLLIDNRYCVSENRYRITKHDITIINIIYILLHPQLTLFSSSSRISP